MTMGLDFPTSPANNDTYSLGSRTWMFNGYGWEIVNTNVGPQGPQGAPGSAEDAIVYAIALG
jgi:hypothetical protein